MSNEEVLTADYWRGYKEGSDDTARELLGYQERDDKLHASVEKLRDMVAAESRLAAAEAVRVKLLELAEEFRRNPQVHSTYSECANRLSSALSAAPAQAAEPTFAHPGAEQVFNELQARRAQAAEPEEDTESLIEQLDEALCSLLHTGGELGEHSPRTHLDLFYTAEQSARADLATARARIAELETEHDSIGATLDDAKTRIAQAVAELEKALGAEWKHTTTYECIDRALAALKGEM